MYLTVTVQKKLATIFFLNSGIQNVFSHNGLLYRDEFCKRIIYATGNLKFRSSSFAIFKPIYNQGFHDQIQNQI